MASEIDERLLELAKREMRKNGWNQRELGDRMGLQESEVSLLFNRKRRWTIQLIQRFTEVTGQKVEIS